MSSQQHLFGAMGKFTRFYRPRSLQTTPTPQAGKVSWSLGKKAIAPSARGKLVRALGFEKLSGVVTTEEAQTSLS